MILLNPSWRQARPEPLSKFWSGRAATSGFTLISLLFDVRFYGFGFLLGSAAYFLYSIIRLNYYTKRLPYYVLSVQPLVNENRLGRMTRLGILIEKQMEGLEKHEA